MDINGQIVVITGGASGLGAKTAEHLAKAGAQIALIDQDGHAVATTAQAIGALGLEGDVTSSASLEENFQQIVSSLGSPTICINCAGIAPAKRIIGREGPMSLSEFERVIAVNLVGTFNTLRLSAFYMSKTVPAIPGQEQGVIINTASIAAYEGQIGQAAYSASKGGVCALTLPAARELAQFNIRVMCIAPGLIQTPLVETFPEKVQHSLENQIPYPKRFGKPKEFAALVAHIIENPYLNGEIIRLDAGLRMF